MKDLKNKNVVITGAASGIGRALALLFASEGSNLALLDIDLKKLENLKTKLNQSGVIIHCYRIDLSKISEITRIAGVIEKDYKQVDILVNNAGIMNGKSIVDTSMEEIQKIIDINILAYIGLIKQFLPAMIKRESGHIVNIASAMGLVAVPNMADYCATKFAIVGYSDALRMEMKKFGHNRVNVTCVCPSGIDTAMFDGYKPPFLSPLLKKQVVAKNIIKAVKNNKAYLKMGVMVKLVPFIKGLPAPVVDWLAKVLRLNSSMDHLIR